MNQEVLDNKITPEEYFTILSQERDLTPKEVMQKRIFEKEFLENCEEHSYHLSQATEDVYGEYHNRMAALISKENKTLLEIEVLEKYQKWILERENKENNEEIVRKLSNDKGGYVNATIILVMILNIGFIIAMTLLGSKWAFQKNAFYMHKKSLLFGFYFFSPNLGISNLLS